MGGGGDYEKMLVVCASCGASYEVGADYSGKSFNCSRCGAVVFCTPPPKFDAPKREESIKRVPAKSENRMPGSVSVRAEDQSSTIYGALASVVGLIWCLFFVVSTILFFIVPLPWGFSRSGFWVMISAWAVFELSMSAVFATAAATFRIADCLCRLAGGSRLFGL